MQVAFCRPVWMGLRLQKLWRARSRRSQAEFKALAQIDAWLGLVKLNDVYGLIGSNMIKNHTLSLFYVKDNRLNKGQSVTHGTWR
jgi:hypothetical protein